MSTAVFCIVQSDAQAMRIVSDLKGVGFAASDVSVLFPDTSGTRDFAHEQGTKAPEGAVAGAGAGGLVGGVVGLLAGVGSLAIPGLGPLIAAGPIMGALGGLAVGGAIGGLTGGLIGLGVPEFEAKRYEGKVRGGNILISVHTENGEEVGRAKDVFKVAGAEDIATASEKRAPVVETRPREGAVRPSEMPPPLI